MAETAWTEEGEAGPKKKRIPTWAWFCGGGCLLAVLIAVVAMGLGVQWFQQATDPEVQWERLAKILPYDERPTEWKLMFGNQVGLQQFQFQDDARGFQYQIQNHAGKDGNEGRVAIFEKDPPQFPQNLGVMKFQDLAPGKVQVQGRELHLLRMRMEFSGFIAKMMPPDAREQLGHMVFVDLTPEGREGMLLLQITRVRDQAPISDDEIRMILKPFHIGPDR